MSWTKSWYLEQRCDGKWTPDSRRWFPENSPIDLNFFSDNQAGTPGLSRELNQQINVIAHTGFPSDASHEVQQDVDRFVQYLADEYLPIPEFGWLLVSDLLQLDLSGPGFQSQPVRTALVDWLTHLRSLGDPEKLRLIFMLWS